MLTHHCHCTSFIPQLFTAIGQIQSWIIILQKHLNMSNFTSLQSVSEAQNFTRSATLLWKAWSTSTKPTKTAFPGEGRWLSPEAPMKSMPSETMVKGACQGSMSFGWASTTWSQKASLSISMESPSPSSTGTMHSLTVASGKTASSSHSQLRANGVTRSVVAARGTYVSSPSPNRPFLNVSSKQDRSWFIGWWIPGISQNCPPSRDSVFTGIQESASLATTLYCGFALPGVWGSRNNDLAMYTLLKGLLQNGLSDLSHSWSLLLVSTRLVLKIQQPEKQA